MLRYTRWVIVLVALIPLTACQRYDDSEHLIRFMKRHSAIQLVDYANVWSEHGPQVAKNKLERNRKIDSSKRVFWHDFFITSSEESDDSKEPSYIIYTSTVRRPTIWEHQSERRIHFFLTDSMNGQLAIYAREYGDDSTILFRVRNQRLSPRQRFEFRRLQSRAVPIWTETDGFVSDN